MKDQTEFPEVPPVGRLNKLRARLLPLADGIIALAKGVEVHPHPDDPELGIITPAASKVAAQRRRELDKRLGALGVPQRSARLEDLPEGTREAAAASGEFFVALESAMSAILGVSDAEEAAIPRAP